MACKNPPCGVAEEEALAAGMEEKAREFVGKGAEVYLANP